MESDTAQYHLIGRFIVILAAGILFGYLIVESSASDLALVEETTREVYEANYETYIAELRTGLMSPVESFLVGLVLAMGLFGLYEGASVGLARVLRAVMGSGGPEASRQRHSDQLQD